jgi:hypothetical protein
MKRNIVSKSIMYYSNVKYAFLRYNIVLRLEIYHIVIMIILIIIIIMFNYMFIFSF